MGNQALADIRLLEKTVNEFNFNAKHRVTMYCQTSDDVVDVATVLGARLIYPDPDGENYYWFLYKSASNPRLSIKVKGPYL